MASHKASLQALVDIKGRSENLSWIAKQKGSNATAKTHYRLQLSAQSFAVIYIYIYVMGNIQVQRAV